ncbi:hypothetical protein Pmani_013674 [Petrolisthes manimaculis]|uniref:RUN domain-containing protein n=1 Tax=Petrolisthes manimaculis TaxID=1843537 RepID=A0AAE1UDD7_9EUCA|nr:hypothetical protein Pmani_013674 [Petrolisthes manimaculis]
MSISDPLIKELKGYILEATKLSSLNEAVVDTQPCLLPLCLVLEAIFRKGLNNMVHSAFGLTKRDYWIWLEKTAQSATGLQNGYKEAVESVANNPCVSSMQGRGRLFIRHALKHKCLHIPIEIIVRTKGQEGIYDADSIIGNEILGEIFLSLLYQCSHINFELQLDNASFLDDTWQLPGYHEYELVPCMDLGVYLGHVSGRAVVVRVEEGSVAAEDNKIEVGDIITEMFGTCIHGWRRGRVSSLLRQKRGLPITLRVIKGHDSTGLVFPGVVPLLRRLQVDVTQLQEKYQGEALAETTETPLIGSIGGQSVEYLGSLSVGETGDVTHIEHAVAAVVSQDRQAVSVALVTGEIGVQTLLRTNRKIILSHSYTEISSCGRRNDMPEYFAYIAGDTSCTISSHFTCFVFRAPSVEQSRDILLTLADGFHRTHWAV